MEFSNKLLTILKKKRLTQRELAKKTGISATTLSSLVNGRSKPKPLTLHKIASVLEINENELTCNAEYGMPSPQIEKLLSINADALEIYLNNFKKDCNSYVRIANLSMLLNQRAGYLAALEMLKEE